MSYRISDVAYSCNACGLITRSAYVWNEHLPACREKHPIVTDQPPPTGNGTPITELVIRDLQERSRVGAERYGTPLRAHNGRDALVDAYHEALDLCQYLRQAIEERG